MSATNQYEVNIHVPKVGNISLTITASSSTQAGSAAKAMYGGNATVNYIKQIN